MTQKLSLNKEQQQAVETIEGPLLILAGAGSGKTHTLVNRISYMIKSGIRPENILTITFTNKAADEMKERIAKSVGERDASRIWASNFHKLGVRLLKTHAESLNTKHDANFTIIENEDSIKIIKNIFEDMGLNPKLYNYKHYFYTISALKNEMVDYESYKQQKPLYPHADWKRSTEVMDKLIYESEKERFLEVYRRYDEYCQEYNVMDFDDLILYPVKLFNDNPDLLEYYQEKFKYIMVDEYQDTNQAQYALLMMLSSKYRNFAVVGDDAQSIYKFRGSDMRNILNFKNDFPDANVISLRQNYRSTDIIVQASNSLIRHNPEQYQKNTYSEKKVGNKIKKYIFYTNFDVVDYIADLIEKEVSDGVSEYKDFAILYRSNNESGPFEKKFIERGIPHRIYGSFSFFKREEVQNVLAYLKFIVNPQDLMSLGRIINLPKRNIGEKTYGNIVKFIHENGVEKFLNDRSDLNISGKAKEELDKFCEQINYFIGIKDTEKPGEFIKKVIYDFGLIEEIKERSIDDEEKENRIMNISNLIIFADEYDVETVAELLDEFSLFTERTEGNSDNEVKLMTVHASKGLEFKKVFVVGLEEDSFPHRISKEQNDVNEERRLMYVAMTRAEEELYLCCSEVKVIFGNKKYFEPSRFLDEIDEKYCIEEYF